MIGRHTRRVLALALAGLALAISGCGDDDDGAETKGAQKALSRAQLIAKGDALCSAYNAKQAELGTPANTRELAEQAAELLPLQEDIGRRLEGLTPRPQDRAAYERVIAVQKELGELNRQRYAAARRGDEQGVRKATSDFRRTYPRYVEAARAFGFKVCATG